MNDLLKGHTLGREYTVCFTFFLFNSIKGAIYWNLFKHMSLSHFQRQESLWFKSYIVKWQNLVFIYKPLTLMIEIAILNVSELFFSCQIKSQIQFDLLKIHILFTIYACVWALKRDKGIKNISHRAYFFLLRYSLLTYFCLKLLANDISSFLSISFFPQKSNLLPK